MPLGPRDFDPYRAEISGCYCRTCRELVYLNSSTYERLCHPRKHEAAAQVLLDELKAGTHHRVEQAEYHAEARAEHDRAVAEAIERGDPPERVETLRRGYVKVSMRDSYATGMGLGMTPGRYQAAMARQAKIKGRMRHHDRNQSEG